MTPHLLLRVVVYGIGLHAAYAGIASLAYYLPTILSDPLGWSAGWQESASAMFGYVIAPLTIALACLGFARAIATFLLGADPRAALPLPAGDTALFRVLLKVVGVYVFATTIGHALATFYEFMAVRSGNTRFDNVQVTSDGIANLVALCVAFVLVVQTDKVIAWIEANSEKK